MAMVLRNVCGAHILPPSSGKLTFSVSSKFAVPSSRRFCISSGPQLSSSHSALPTAKKVIVPIGFGNEEIEVTVLVDVLRRAGADVLMASVEDELQVECSRKVKIVADTQISSCDKTKFDLIALPGGMPGSARLQQCESLKNMTVDQIDQEKLVGAISSSPALLLEQWGLLEARMATCHPGFVDKISPTFLTRARVQTDGCITTSQGPGTAIDFALSLVEQLYDQEKLKELQENLVLGSKVQKEALKSEFNPVSWKAARVPQVLVPVSMGVEEMEAVIVVDVLRRANMNVIVASVEQDLQILGSGSIKIVADKHIEDVKDSHFDIIILPGGMPGADRLHSCSVLKKIIRKQIKEERPFGGIGVAPAIVFEANGWLRGKKATCDPVCMQNLPRRRVATSRVVLDGYIITSQGPGTAMEFSLCIVEKFFGKERAASVAKGLVFDYE